MTIARSDALANFINGARPPDPRLWEHGEVAIILAGSPDLVILEASEARILFEIPEFPGYCPKSAMALQLPSGRLSLRYDDGAIINVGSDMMLEQQLCFRLEGLDFQGIAGHYRPILAETVCEMLGRSQGIDSLKPQVLIDLPDNQAVELLSVTTSASGSANNRYGAHDRVVNYECFASEAGAWLARWQTALGKESKQMAASHLI